jgi:HAMP domain-containing protein
LDIPKLAAAMVGTKEIGHTSYYSPQEQTRQMVGFAPLEEQPWVLAVNKPNAQFAAPLNHLIWQNSRSLLAVGAIAAIIALLLARSIVRPIRALTKAAQAMEEDYFEPQALAEVSRSQDDIGQLVRVFLQMAQKLKAREQNLKQQVMELRIEIDEAKKVRQVAEITETDDFQQLQKKVQKLRNQSVTASETETDYYQRLQQKVQQLKVRVVDDAK